MVNSQTKYALIARIPGESDEEATERLERVWQRRIDEYSLLVISIPLTFCVSWLGLDLVKTWAIYNIFTYLDHFFAFVLSTAAAALLLVVWHKIKEGFNRIYHTLYPTSMQFSRCFLHANMLLKVHFRSNKRANQPCLDVCSCVVSVESYTLPRRLCALRLLMGLHGPS